MLTLMSTIALSVGNHYIVQLTSGIRKQAMAEMLSTTGHRHHMRPVDVFIAGIAADVVGTLSILGAIYIPFSPGLAFGFKLGGFLLLAAGTTAAALALLRQDDAAQGY